MPTILIPLFIILLFIAFWWFIFYQLYKRNESINQQGRIFMQKHDIWKKEHNERIDKSNEEVDSYNEKFRDLPGYREMKHLTHLK